MAKRISEQGKMQLAQQAAHAAWLAAEDQIDAAIAAGCDEATEQALTDIARPLANEMDRLNRLYASLYATKMPIKMGDRGCGKGGRNR